MSTLRGCSGCRRAKASRCWISSAQRSAAWSISSARLLQRPAGCCRLADQRLGGAGDDRQHVVEVVRDAAGELADRVELLRLLQLALGFAGRGDVVIDQRRAGDRACRVAQRPAADHQMARAVAAARADDDFLLVELLAAQRARRRHFVGRQRRDAVGVVDVGLRAQIARSSRSGSSMSLRRRIRQQHVVPLASITSTASAMLWKVLCSTLRGLGR